MEYTQIFQSVRRHHQLVVERGYNAVMTVLIGSQNYQLDIENSDIDTFTFVFPTVADVAYGRAPESGQFDVEDGICMYKDIRVALNLLKKTSPNSVECFVGQYRYFEPLYKDILTAYLCNTDKLNKMVHCNYSHMLYAIAGMAHQLTKRNMPAGKRYSHSMRLLDMADVFTHTLDTHHLLKLSETHLEEARKAKRDIRKDMEEYYNRGCMLIANQLDEIRNKFVITEYQAKVEQEGLMLIEQLQRELFQKYIE